MSIPSVPVPCALMAARAARRVAFGLALLGWVASATAADIGQIKVSRGQVSVERNGHAMPGSVGARLQPGDVLKTGPDGSVGITMTDSSLLSAGPNSVLLLDHYEYDDVTDKGRFDAQLKKGSLSVVSGRIAKDSPEAMTVRTPAAILGVRGTEFIVTANE
jgi:hypothetical protein